MRVAVFKRSCAGDPSPKREHGVFGRSLALPLNRRTDRALRTAERERLDDERARKVIVALRRRLRNAKAKEIRRVSARRPAGSHRERWTLG